MHTGSALLQTLKHIMNAYASEKLVAFKKAQSEYNDVNVIINNINNDIEKAGTIVIGTSVSIKDSSSEKQFLYALSLLHSNITACAQLGVSDEKYTQTRDEIIALWKLIQDRKAWRIYAVELQHYLIELKSLLSDEDKFNLLTYPESPEVK